MTTQQKAGVDVLEVLRDDFVDASLTRMHDKDAHAKAARSEDALAAVAELIDERDELAARLHEDRVILDAIRLVVGGPYDTIAKRMVELIEANRNLTRAVRGFADGEMSTEFRNRLFLKRYEEPAAEAFSELCVANDRAEAALARVGGAA